MKKKLSPIIVLAMLVFLNQTVMAEGDYFFAPDYFGKPWWDANKNMVDDAHMCWAATSANVLAWGGWTTATYSNATQIFDKFKADYGDTSGGFSTALDYWFNRVDGGGFFPGYRYTDYMSGGGVSDLFRLLHEGYGLYCTIQSYLGGHALSCWGYLRRDLEYTHIYYTDSNDLRDVVKSAGIRCEGVGHFWYLDSGTYEDWRIMNFSGLLPRPFADQAAAYARRVVPSTPENLRISAGTEFNQLFLLRPFLSFDYKWELPFSEPQIDELPGTFLVQLQISEDNWLTLFEKNILDEQETDNWKSLNIPIDEEYQGMQQLRFLVEGDGQVSLYRLSYVSLIPLPGSVWLLGTGLLGLGALGRWSKSY